MATTEDYNQRGAYLIYSLFYKYASTDSGHTSYGDASISYIRMKELMLDMDMLEGVHPALLDACVREHMQRADQEGSGVIGAQDFVVWLLTEVAALLPVRDAFCLVTGLRPLYNQFHAVLLGDVGFTDGARRPLLGMAAAQFSRLAEEYGLSGSSEGVRNAFKAARASVGAFRASSGANTGAQMAEPAGGGRLQFAAFVRALAMLAAQRMGSLDAALYQVVSCGVAANLTDPRVLKPPLPPAEMTSLGLSSQLEGSCHKEAYMCGNCGQEHQRWRLDNWVRLEELLLALGIPQPVRRFMPALPLLNARNLRVAFHRYNMMYNKGKLPPASYRLSEEGALDTKKAVPPATAPDIDGDAGGDGADQPEDDAFIINGSAGGGGGGGGCCSPAASYGACCCLFRSLSVMEMSSWLRVCGDCDAIREMITTHGSGVTPATLESAFVQASSIAGVYFPDDSSGIHDVPIGPGDGGAKLGLPRNSLGAVVGSEARAAPDHPPPKRSTAAYQAPPDGHPMAAATGGGGGANGGGGIVPRLHEVRGPSSAAAWLASARSVPYGGGAGGGSSAAAARGQQHRPSRLVLTFPQFIEALRLVAEEAGGHPTRTAAAERALLRIVHDIVREGCPRPDPTTATGTAQLRRQHMRRAAGVTPASSTTRPQTAPAADPPPQQQPSPPVPPTAAAVADHFSGTSSTTSTKYTYDDFTPPESNLYTSATSSRISSRPGSASGGRNTGKGGGSGGGGAAATATTGPKGTVGGSSSSSTKYTYSDFTAPDSNLYTSSTSASGSRVGSSRVGHQMHQPLSTQSWRPQPLRAFSNPNAGGGTADGKPVPTQLQPKKRSVAAAPAVTAPGAAAAAAPPPGQTSTWIATMPAPPSSRIPTQNTLPMSGSVSLSGGGASCGSGGGAGAGTNGASVPRQRPMSAPRVRQQPPAVGLGERVEYIWYGTSAAAVSSVGSGGDRPTSHPRPASAKQPVGQYSVAAEPSSPSGWANSMSGGGAAGCAAAGATAVTPPFAQRARPASASAQRPRPHTASDGNSRPRSPSPPPPVSYPAVTAAAATSGLTAAAMWEPPGVSGQIRTSSPTKTHPSSANAALGRRGSPATARQPVSGSRAGGGGAASAGVGVASPLSRWSHVAPAGPAAAATAVVGCGNRPPDGRPSLQSNLGRSGGNSRTPSGTGFVAPLLPAGGSGGGGGGGGTADRTRSPPPRPPSAAIVAVAAAMKGEAAAAAALSAAAAARHGAIGRPPLQKSASGEYVSVTVHPNTPPDPRGFGNAGAGKTPGSRGDSPALAAPPLPPAPSGGSGLRNLLLLQAALDSSPSVSSPGSPVARSSPDHARTLPAAAPSASIRRTNSTAATAVAPVSPSSGPSQLEHVLLPYEPVSLPISSRVVHRSASTGSGGGGAKAPPSLPSDQEDNEAAAAATGPWGGILAAVAHRDDASSLDGGGADDIENAVPPSPRAVLAATVSMKGLTAGGRGRSRLPAEGTVNGLPQYFFG
ncbi:hypothetical protein Vafri_6408 [Volvox africanus]|uniref:EF-hand domain-containing protein n=1 Tax=Volvox africanus TaxID=51714 RepID=A0A8J4EWN0_9CHLO|nr:hypothetical protein Vafri_6408 [Volvox africanus]